PLPFADPSRLMMVFGTNTERGDQYDVSSYPTYLDWQEQNHSFASMAAFTHRELVVGVANDFMLASGQAVTPNTFDVLGVSPALGRTSSALRPAPPDVVLRGDGFWKRTFGGDRGVVGGTMRIDERVHTIVGVMPPGFQIEGERENFYEPLAIDTSRGHGFLHVVARLQPGATLHQAGDDMRAIADRVAATCP